jgi:high affinity Mn2+ porin
MSNKRFPAPPRLFYIHGLPAVALLFSLSAHAQSAGEATEIDPWALMGDSLPPAENGPDKSHYSLFNPTPDDQMRPFSTDRPGKTHSSTTVDAGHFQVESDFINYAYDHHSPQQQTAPAAGEQTPPATSGVPEWYSLHIQGTATDQSHPPFHSAIQDAPQSMKSRAQSAETTDMTLFAGARVGGLELYANPEMDQGFGLSNTFGVAGFPNGESGKVGSHEPYFHLPRLFGRYVLGLGGEQQNVEDGPNQLSGSHNTNNATFTFGKFSVVDIFDNNSYAHDPRADFLNWSIIDMGAFDYAAEAWGYTYGGAAEWTQDWWTLRGGIFDMSRQPNDKYLMRGFGQYQAVAEAEERHEIFGNPGKAKALFFASSANMGSYVDSLSLANQTSATPSTSLVRRRQIRPGGGINIEQQVTPDLGAFLRASMNDGTKEAFEYTEINRSVSGGLSLKGERWSRPDDTIGLGGAINGISNEARQYLAAGGQGILIGDGSLNYAPEEIIETYYNYSIVKSLTTTFDYQFINNPAYNQDRGPVHVFAVRAHAEF